MARACCIMGRIAANVKHLRQIFLVSEQLEMTGEQFIEKAIGRNLLMVPGGIFSNHDTHNGISYATSNEKLQEEVEILNDLAKK